MDEKIAIPVCNGRVSPVFDTARHVLIVEASQGKEMSRRQVETDAISPAHRADWLFGHAVDTLICAGISIPLANLIESLGIRLCPAIVGDVDEVLQAYLNGNHQQPRFAMPGCCGRRFRFRYGRRTESRGR